MNRETALDGRHRLKPYPFYKDSGIEWLGKIPAHWDIKRLGSSVMGCQNGVWGNEPNGFNDMPCVRVADFDRVAFRVNIAEPTMRSIDERVVRKHTIRVGDLLLEKSGGGDKQPVGAVVMYDHNISAVCSNFIARMPVAEGFSPRFLTFFHAALYASRINTRSIKQNTGIQNLDSGSYLNEVVACPALREQIAIASFLDRETAKIDALIEKKERLIKLLQEKRTALITQAVTKGLDPTVPMKDSGVEWLGKIPAHWTIEPNKRIFRESDVRSEFGDEELLTVSHLSGVTKHSEKNVTMIEAESLEDYKVCRAGELAINTMWAWMGALGISNEDGIVSPSYNVYVLRTSSLDPRYYDYLCRTPLHVAELTKYSKGVWKSRLRLYPDGFFKISTPLPPIKEQERIANQLDNAVREMDALLMIMRRAIGCFKEYRTALIAVTVTGKIAI